MKKVLFGFGAAALAIGALAVANAPVAVAQGAENCKTIRMGFNPAQDATKVLTSAKPIANYLEEQIRGVEVKASVAQDYRGLIEAMRSGQLDFAWLNPVGYVDAAREGIANVLLKSSREAGPYYWAAFIVRADSRFKKLEDLQGASVAWVDPNSAAGYTFPRATLISAKLEPDKLFSKQVFAGGHDAVVFSVLNGTVDVGATFANNTKGTSGSWTQYLSDPAQQKRIRVLAYSKPIPGDTVSVRKGFEASCKDAVTKVVGALLRMRSQEATRKLLRDLYRIEFLVTAKDSDYNIVRDAQAAAAKK
jgi:phosphonate transport system substrate-binding protein